MTMNKGSHSMTHLRKAERGRAAGIIGLTIGAIAALMPFGAAWPQATLLPNAVQQWIDGNGNPLASGTVYHYVPGTTQTKTVWQNSAQTIPWSNPITLNAAGEPSSANGVYGSGSYRQVVYDSLGNLLYDALTASTGTSTASGTAGDGMPLGFVMPFYGTVPPDGYLFANGLTISRTTYADFMTAITINQTANCTATSTTLSSLSDTSQMRTGAPIESACLPPGTTIATIAGATSITVSAAATSTGSNSVRVFPWGNGNGATTFTLPDLRGRIMAGRDSMGQVGAGRLTSTHCSNPNGLASPCGAQTHTLTQPELPAFKPALTSVVTDAGHTHNGNANTLTSTGGNTGAAGADFARAASAQATSSSTTGVTVATTFDANLGSATPFSVLQPTALVNYVVKVSANSGTFNVAVGNNTVIGNNSGSTAAPVAITASAVLDMICSTRGSILERGIGGWVCLTPGTAGYAFVSNGPGMDPSWTPVTGGCVGCVTLTGNNTFTGTNTFTGNLITPYMVFPANYGGAQAAADVAANKMLVLSAGDAVTVAIPSQYATCQDAVNATAQWVVPYGASVTFQYTGHINVAGTICLIDRPDADRFKHRGTTALTRTLSNVTSVTGSAGAWAVTATLNDVTGINIGDVAMFRDIVPGVKAPGSYTGRPALGALQYGFYTMGYLTVSGTSATLSGSAATTYMANGDMVMIRGEFRTISALTGNSFTLSSALTSNITAEVGWYHLRQNTGTIAVAGPGNITGTGTVFLSQANVGDLMAIEGLGVYTIESITNDLTAKLDASLTVGAGTRYAVISSGEFHEGAWEVTGIAGSTVTVLNKSQPSDYRMKPPVNLVSGGNVRILTSVLKTTTVSSGFLVQTGTLDIDHLALIGSGGAFNPPIAGINVEGIDTNTPNNPDGVRGIPGHVKLGYNTAVLNFGDGVYAQGQSNVFARGAMFTGNQVGAFLNFGGELDFKEGVSNGNSLWGVYLGPGTGGELSDVRLNVNGIFGLHMIDSFRGSYGEYPYMEGNGARGLHTDGNAALHWNGTRFVKNGDGAITSDNGIWGRGSESLFMANRGGSAANIVRGNVEMQYSTYVGNLGVGLLVNRGRAAIGQSGFNSNGTAIRALSEATITADANSFTGNTLGLDVTGGGTWISVATSGFVGNATVASVTNGGNVWAKGYTGTITPITPATLNQTSSDGAGIYVGTDTVFTYANLVLGSGGALQTNTGVGNTALLQGYNTGTASYNTFGTITAGSPPTFTMNPTSIGATTPGTAAFTTLSASGIASFANGSASNPSITFTNDTSLNSGFYRIAEDRLGLTLNGALMTDFQTGGMFTTGVGIFTATNSSAFAVGRQGGTSPAFQVDSNTASSITGIKVTAAATGGGVAVAAIGETNVNTTINAAGTGTLSLNSSNTGDTILNRHVRAAGTAPALTSCGTSPTITGSDMSGTVTMGTGSPTGCVITFNVAYTAAPHCVVSWRVNIVSMQYTTSTTALTLTQTGTSSNLVDYICMAGAGG